MTDEHSRRRGRVISSERKTRGGRDCKRTLGVKGEDGLLQNAGAEFWNKKEGILNAPEEVVKAGHGAQTWGKIVGDQKPTKLGWSPRAHTKFTGLKRADNLKFGRMLKRENERNNGGRKEKRTDVTEKKSTKGKGRFRHHYWMCASKRERITENGGTGRQIKREGVPNVKTVDRKKKIRVSEKGRSKDSRKIRTGRL